MEKGKNRTDLLAAGRKKLQQFRQKKDHKPTSTSSSSHGKSSQKPGEQNEGGDAESASHDSSVDTESTKASQPVDAVEADAATGDQGVLPVTKLLVTLAGGGSVGTVVEEEMQAESLASNLAGEASGKVGELQDSGDPPDLLSGDRGSGPCQTSGQDADCSGLEQCDRSVDNSSEVGTSGNGHEAGMSMPIEVKEDIPRAAGPSLEAGEVEDPLPLPAEGADKVDDNISMSEVRLNEDAAVTCQGIGIEQEMFQTLTIENQNDELLFASGTAVRDAGKTDEGTVACGKLGFGQVADATQLPKETTDKVDLAIVHGEGTSDDERLDSRPAAQVSKRENEESIVPEDREGSDKFSQDGTEERDPYRLSIVVEEEYIREDMRGNPVLVREDVKESFSGEGSSVMKLRSSIPRAFTSNMEDTMEILKRHLYLANVIKDFLQLQLTEQIDKQVEIDLKFSDDVSRLQNLLHEAQEKSSGIHEELDQCKNDLQVMFSNNNDLEIQCLSARSEIEGLNAQVVELHNELELSQNDYKKLSAELADCKNVVGTSQIENSNLTAKILSGKEKIQKLEAEKEQSTVQIEDLTTRTCEMQNDLELSQKESMKLSAELADFKGLMMALQAENSTLTLQILSGTEDMNKLKAENDVVVNENKMLVSSLSEQKDQLAIALEKVAELEGDFKETMVSVEKLTEENAYLLSYLDIHKSKVKELENDFQELLAHAQEFGECAKDYIAGSIVSNNVTGDSHISHGTCAGKVVDKAYNLVDPSLARRPSVQVEENDPNEPAVLRILRGHFVEAEEMLQNLEKAILGMHAHHVALSKPGGRPVNSGVSKLIQAFESKTRPDTTASDDMALVEGEKLAESDSFNFTKEHLCSLKANLKQMAVDAEMIKVLSNEEHDSMCIAKKFEVECESLKFQNNELQRTIDELGIQLTDYKLSLDNLQSKLESTWHDADEMSRRLLDQVESMQKEVNVMEGTLGKEMNMMKNVISESSQKLDAHTGPLLDGSLDTNFHITASVNAVTKLIEELQEKLEAACLDRDKSYNSYDELYKNYACLSESHESTNRILSQTHGSFAKLIRDFSGDMEKPVPDTFENAVDVKAEELQQLSPGDFEILTEQFSKLLNGKSLLHSVKGELESELALRNQDIEELKEQCTILAKSLQESNFTMEELKEHRATLAKSLQESNSTIDELQSLLTKRDQDFDELSRACVSLVQEVGNWEMNKSQFLAPELVGNVEIIAKSDKMEIGSIKQLLVHFGTLVASLLQMYGEAAEQLNLSRNYLQEIILHSEQDHSHLEPLHLFIKQNIIPRVSELLEFKEKVNLLTSKDAQQENELQILKDSLSRVEEALQNSRSELNSKVSELEQSEQRLSSVREKLSIAVSKGKGLIVQRDSLKQTLMEKTSELEMCLQELQSKEARLFDLETKLKSSEADRVEALESELSYIRNSATAFRDSFLQKDSILQKIEEVMEELDLPEDFHSKDIVEKVDWLAKFATESTSFQSTDWEQKNSLGGSQADPGPVGTDTKWKDSLQSVSSPGQDDLKRKYEELLNRFYGLAEQNDMLEQSLMERNDLVRRWEKVLDRIDMPLQLKCLEPEDRLEWLGRKLLEVQQDRDSLLTKIDNVEISTESLLSDLEASQKKISELNAAFDTIRRENEFLSENLAKLRSEHFQVLDRAAQNELEKDDLLKEIAGLQEKLADLDQALVTMRHENESLSGNMANLRSEHLELLGRAAQNELEKDDLQKEIADLQEKLAEKSDCKACTEILTEMKKLHDLIGEALPYHDKPDTSSSDRSINCLESSLRKLVDNYTTFSLERNVIPHDSSGVCNNMMLEDDNLKQLLGDKEQTLMALKVELDEVSHNLAVAKGERDTIIERCNMHVSEMEALAVQRNTLQQEREIAVDKYQSLVSDLEAMIKQRDLLQDQLKQEEQRSASMREKLNVAVRKGKGLVQQRDSLKQTIEEMKTELDHLQKELNQRVEILQSENNLLRSTLAESENTLLERSQTLNSLFNALYSIDLGADTDIIDPIQRLQYIGKLINDMRTAVASFENEAIKSKKAAELLVAELNEVQEGAENLQDDLVKAEAELAQYSREKVIVEGERRNAVSHLEQLMIAHNEEKKTHLGSIIRLRDDIFGLRKSSVGLSKMLANVLSRDVDLLCSMKLSVESIMKLVDDTNSVFRPLLAPTDLLSDVILSEDATFSADGVSETDISGGVDGGVITEYIQVAGHSLYECGREFSVLKEKLLEHSFTINEQFKALCEMVEVTQSRIASRELSSDSLKRDIAHFEMIIKNKENELNLTYRNITLLHQACRKSILELENRKAQVVGKSGASLTLPSWVHEEGHVDAQTSFSEDFIRTVADSLLTTVKGSSNILEEVVEERQKELKATMLDFQRELQEKDMQQNRICAELVSQIREAEAVAKKFSVDLDSAKLQVEKLESQIKEMEDHQKVSEVRFNELKSLEASAKEYEQRIKSLMDSLTAKDQEIEGLIQALDEEESQMEGLQSRNQELEQVVRQNNLALENLEASRAKALAKLSTTLSRFDELHRLSESLVSEIENLQSQIQEQDSEISFLRQEVARCTNDVLAKQEGSKKVLSDLHEVQTWMDTMVLRLGGHKLDIDNQNGNQIHSYIKYLDKQIPSVIAELEDLRIVVQNKDALLDIEKGRVNELSHRAEVLEVSLREKESQVAPSGGSTEPGQPLTVNSPDSLEVEPMINKRSALGSTVSHARSGRRVNTDHIAVAIDLEQDNSTLDDEDDDKAHGFKSLTTSKIVPRATRPIADRIDGLWVSIERLLMRQPSLRLGLILYWVVVHALLAASI
ncbi:hypothetical protein Taro_016014 [Colocasia esculenta]|uniref:Uncharacterized protein n=1 Tax=Colocasia esculenta TaxID=4460 RepID=A0A843URP8_COLES|nr:hypothetical protein [Colocasia esculenta]